MDTRRKIVTTDEAAKAIASWRASGERPVVVTGFFDPLLASHARRLEHAAKGNRLVVALRDPEDPILASRARAELVAALRAVALVVLPGSADLGMPVTSCEEDDRLTSAEFVERVRRKNAS